MSIPNQKERTVLDEILDELNSLSPQKHPVAFAFTLMSALDLLAQLNSGKLKKIGAVKRFKRFASEYLKLKTNDQEILYQFRNAVVHTYGQYAFNEKTKAEYRFTFHFDDELWLKKISRIVYSINLVSLQNRLDKAIIEFYQNVNTDPELKKRHDLVFKKIGTPIQNGSKP